MSEFKPITFNTQEECDNFMKDRISRVEKKYEGFVAPTEHQKAIDDLTASYEEKLSSYEANKATYEEKLSSFEAEKTAWAEKENGYKAKISEYETNSAKKAIAKSYGLDESLFDRLQGSNEDEWKADAEKLSSLFHAQRSQPSKGNNQGSVDDVYKNLLNGALKK